MRGSDYNNYKTVFYKHSHAGVTVGGYSEFYAYTGVMHFRTVEDWSKTQHLLYERYTLAITNLESFWGRNTGVYQIR